MQAVRPRLPDSIIVFRLGQAQFVARYCSRSSVRHYSAPWVNLSANALAGLRNVDFSLVLASLRMSRSARSQRTIPAAVKPAAPTVPFLRNASRYFFGMIVPRISPGRHPQLVVGVGNHALRFQVPLLVGIALWFYPPRGGFGFRFLGGFFCNFWS